jgi:hypothetical protein
VGAQRRRTRSAPRSVDRAGEAKAIRRSGRWYRGSGPHRARPVNVLDRNLRVALGVARQPTVVASCWCIELRRARMPAGSKQTSAGRRSWSELLDRSIGGGNQRFESTTVRKCPIAESRRRRRCRSSRRR